MSKLCESFHYKNKQRIKTRQTERKNGVDVVQRLGSKPSSAGAVRRQVDKISALRLLPIGQAAGVALQWEISKGFFGFILLLVTTLLCATI